jgi:hypothetical protein
MHVTPEQTTSHLVIWYTPSRYDSRESLGQQA